MAGDGVDQPHKGHRARRSGASAKKKKNKNAESGQKNPKVSLTHSGKLLAQGVLVFLLIYVNIIGVCI